MSDGLQLAKELLRKLKDGSWSPGPSTDVRRSDCDVERRRRFLRAVACGPRDWRWARRRFGQGASMAAAFVPDEITFTSSVSSSGSSTYPSRPSGSSQIVQRLSGPMGLWANSWTYTASTSVTVSTALWGTSLITASTEYGSTQSIYTVSLRMGGFLTLKTTWPSHPSYEASTSVTKLITYCAPPGGGGGMDLSDPRGSNEVPELPADVESAVADPSTAFERRRSIDFGLGQR